MPPEGHNLKKGVIVIINVVTFLTSTTAKGTLRKT